MPRSDHLTNLALYRTPRERIRTALIGLLSYLVACAAAWGAGFFLMRFLDSGGWLGPAIVLALVALIVHLLRWFAWVRRFWLPVALSLALVAAMPFVMRVQGL